jgi:hypothetical protein
MVMTQPSPMRPVPGAETRTPRAERQAPPNRRLHIDIQRLTLPGYTPDQQQRFTQTLHAELNRLARNVSSWNGALHTRMARLDAGQLNVAATPEDTARQLAARLFDRLHSAKGASTRV